MSDSQQTQPQAAKPLWTTFLPFPGSRPPLLSTSRTNTLSNVPTLTPSDKSGTSLRLLLQDTQHTVEKFSERLDNLFKSLEQSKRSVSDVGKLMAESHDRVIEETRNSIHGAKSEIEEALANTITKESFEEVKKQQASMVECFQTVQIKLSAMDSQMNHHFEAESSSWSRIEHVMESQAKDFNIRSEVLNNQIQGLVNNHTQLLAALGAVATLSPLFKVLHNMPNHRDSAVSDVTKAVEAAREIAPMRQTPSLKRSLNLVDSPCPTGRKKARHSAQRPTVAHGSSGKSKPPPFPSSDATLFNTSVDAIPVVVDQKGAGRTRGKTPTIGDSQELAQTAGNEQKALSHNPRPSSPSPNNATLKNGATTRSRSASKKNALLFSPGLRPSSRRERDREVSTVFDQLPGAEEELPESPTSPTQNSMTQQSAASPAIVKEIPALTNETFCELNRPAEDEAEVSIDMDFIWGSLPADSEDDSSL